jgi:hypothetical protein
MPSIAHLSWQILPHPPSLPQQRTPRFTAPTWLFIALAVFDTTISFLCLGLFLIPVLSFHKLNARTRVGPVDKYAVVNTTLARLQAAAWMNLKWTAFSTLATFLYMTSALMLLPTHNTLWVLLALIDLNFSIYSIAKLFPKSTRKRGDPTTTKGARVDSSDSVKKCDRQNSLESGLSEVPQSVHNSVRLFD